MFGGFKHHDPNLIVRVVISRFRREDSYYIRLSLIVNTQNDQMIGIYLDFSKTEVIWFFCRGLEGGNATIVGLFLTTETAGC